MEKRYIALTVLELSNPPLPKRRVLAIKVKKADDFQESKISMMDYAAEIGLKTFTSIEVYIVPCPRETGCDLAVSVMPLVPGRTLKEVWLTLNKSMRCSLAQQLCEQLMIEGHHNTLHWAGALSVFSPILIGAPGSSQIQNTTGGRLDERNAKTLSPTLRGRHSKAFVLTHGHLDPEKVIVVKNTDDSVVASGILDW
ncbi:hypothetical protein PRK78_007393 [Emydomyces testavorans]|uniref:Uncharacterized protein n=1 Tax=Emydomyces testavorans TaxID=2070801 RepID=A0AAF0DRY4_9EURO|nr:hypothetical protein PRK78_007393 [Emydomyces testavorans]